MRDAVPLLSESRPFALKGSAARARLVSIIELQFELVKYVACLVLR